MAKPLKIAVIPDCQVRKGVSIKHLAWAGEYIADKRPDVVVHLGDFADVPSFSIWDAPGSLAAEGRRFAQDKEAAWRGMDALMTPIRKARGYKPRLELTYGNHEWHIVRQIERDPRWQGTISLKDLRYEEYGWKCHEFLRPVKIAGFYFSHYFPSGKMAKPCGTARKMLSTFHVSCIAGHTQGLDDAVAYKPDGHRIMCFIAGSFYQHDEAFIPFVTNRHWRGLLFLHEARDGEADPMMVSLNFLKRRYG